MYLDKLQTKPLFYLLRRGPHGVVSSRDDLPLQEEEGAGVAENCGLFGGVDARRPQQGGQVKGGHVQRLQVCAMFYAV